MLPETAQGRRWLSQDNGQDEDKDNIISLEATVPAALGAGSDKLVFEDQNGKPPDAVSPGAFPDMG
jgi:hypothetical protein